MAATSYPGSAEAFTVIKGTVIGRDGWLFYYADDPRENRGDRRHVVATTINATVRQFEAAGIKTVIVFIPSKSRLYRSELPEDLDFTPESAGRYKSSLKMLRESGALAPDLEDGLLALHDKSPNAPLYFRSDTHWTPVAAEAAANLVADEMNRSLNLPNSNAAGLKLTQAEEVKTFLAGDLARMLPPDQRKNYPAEHVTRTGTVSSGGQLIENETADVAVVGCSFMQPPLNFAPMLSARLNRPVSLTWRVHDVGPYATMLEYLESKEFRRSRPKVIVWNFLENDLTLLINNNGSFGQHAITAKDFHERVQAALLGNQPPKASITASLQ